VFGVEPICRVLSKHGTPITPSTYYEARNRAPSRRAVREQQLKVEVARMHQAKLRRLRGPQGLAPAQP
jgi:putative transposase